MADGVWADENVTRTEWLERGLAVGAGLVSGGIVVGGFASPAASSPSYNQDLKVLNFALAFEELQADLYARALHDTSLQGEWLHLAQTVAEHERAHVAFLRRQLGPAAKPSPRFELAPETLSPGGFQHLAAFLEDLGVAMYIGQVGNLTAGSLAAVGKIMSVESRHAAWARDLAGEEPAPVASDVPADATQVLARLRGEGVGIV